MQCCSPTRRSAHRITRTILVLACACLGGSAIQPAAAAPLPPSDKALVYVRSREISWTRIEALGLPVYARVEGRRRSRISLIGADPGAAAGTSTGLSG